MTVRNSLGRFLLVAAAAAAFPVMTQAADVYWDNSSGDGDWNNPLNWSTDTIPVGDPIDAVFVNPAVGPASITANIPVPRDFNFGGDEPNMPGSGTVNHTSGAANMFSWLRMGIGGPTPAGQTNTYNLSGTGTMDIGGRIYIAESDGTNATFNQ